MRSTMGRLNLTATAQQLTAESAAGEQGVPPAPTWRVPKDPLGGSPIPEETATVLRQSRGSGAPLPDSVARTAGSALGADLSSVRVHTDARADGLARSMQAVAFSYGPDMYFSQGTYRPNSAAGSHLLAHELSHVAEGPGGGSDPVIGRADDPAEARADHAAAKLAPALRRSTTKPQPGAAAQRTGTTQGGVIPGDIRRAVLRRTITSLNKRSTDIEAANGSPVTQKDKSFRRAITGSKNSLFKIGALLDQLQQAPDDETTLFYLGGLVVMCEHWLDRHEAADNPKLTALIEDVYAEARRDRSNALAQRRYLSDMKLGETSTAAPKPGFRRAGKTKPTPLTQQIGQDMHDRAGNLVAGAERAKDPNAKSPAGKKKVNDLINSCGLTQAEVAAIIAYTASDYLYINPATAASPGWMGAQQAAVAKAATAKHRGTDHLDQGSMQREGVVHAGVLMQALAKMPVMKGTTYRGARMTQKEFDETYGRRRRIVYPAFTSTSTSIGTCNQYAKGMGEQGVRDGQEISVKAYLTVTNGRDVKLLSDAGGENEWLLLPGATFKVSKIEDDPVQEPGAAPKATQWKIVYLEQVANSQSAPMMPSTAAPMSKPAGRGGPPPARPTSPLPAPARPTAPLPAAPPPAAALPAIAPSPDLSTAAALALLKLASGQF